MQLGRMPSARPISCSRHARWSTPARVLQPPCSLSLPRAIRLDSEAALEAPVVPSGPLPTFKILYKDEHLVAVEKPRGFFVHPPENGRPCPVEENMLYLLKHQLGGQWLYPVHRLDRATSGVVLYCLSNEAASQLSRSLREREVKKVYFALVRGYTDTYGVINDPVGGQPSCTLYETLARFTLPGVPIGKWKSPRFSLVRVEPLTGRYHQIRRHMNYISHPIIGDGDHGDRYHNRAFANVLGLPGMYLKAAYIECDHPGTEGVRLGVATQDWEPRWQAVFDAVGQCPVVPPTSTSARREGAHNLKDILPLAAALNQLEIPAPAEQPSSSQAGSQSEDEMQWVTQDNQQPAVITSAGRLALLLPRPTQDPSAGRLSVSRAALAAPKGTWVVASSPAQLTLTPCYYSTSSGASGNGGQSLQTGQGPGISAGPSAVLSNLTLCVQLQGGNSNSSKGGPQGVYSGHKSAPGAGTGATTNPISSPFTFTTDLLDSRHAVKLLLPKGRTAAVAGLAPPEQAQSAAAVLLVSPVTPSDTVKPGQQGHPRPRGAPGSTQSKTHNNLQQQQPSSNTWPWAPQPAQQNQGVRKPQLPTSTTRPLVTQPLNQQSNLGQKQQTASGPVLAFLFSSRADAERAEALLVYAASDPPPPPVSKVHPSELDAQRTQVPPQPQVHRPQQGTKDPAAQQAQPGVQPPAQAAHHMVSTQLQGPVARPPLAMQASLVPAKRPAPEQGLAGAQPLHTRLPTTVAVYGSSSAAGGGQVQGLQQPGAAAGVTLPAGQAPGNAQRQGLQAGVASMAAGGGSGASGGGAAAHVHAFNELVKGYMSDPCFLKLVKEVEGSWEELRLGLLMPAPA